MSHTSKQIKLDSIHSRVIEASNLNKFKVWEQIRSDLCGCCQYDILNNELYQDHISDEDKQAMIDQCTAIDWMCKLKKDLYGALPSYALEGIEDRLLTVQEYANRITRLMKEQIPTRAIMSIHQLHKKMKMHQGHLRRCMQEAEMEIFSHYHIWSWDKLGDLPPLGWEFKIPKPCAKIKTQTNLCECEQCEWELSTSAGSHSDNDSSDDLLANPMKCEDKTPEDYMDLLNQNLAEMRHTDNPCQFCIRLKKKLPYKIIDCSGNPTWDSFKYYMFHQSPPNLFEIKCDSIERLREIINEIFKLKYPERAAQVLNRICIKINTFQPQMKKYTTLYQVLFYRSFFEDLIPSPSQNEQFMEIDI